MHKAPTYIDRAATEQIEMEPSSIQLTKTILQHQYLLYKHLCRKYKFREHKRQT